MIQICVLNFNKPVESELCLRSIKQFCQFDHQVIFFNNGGNDSDRIIELYYEGLIDRLILNKTNEGGGITKEVIDNVSSDYIFWIENDCSVAFTITQNDIDTWVRELESGRAHCIDTTGGICGANTYSGRSFFINTEFYKSIKKCGDDGIYSGPGPKMGDGRYIEWYIQQEFKNKNYKVAHIRAISDNGYSSIRENPDKSLWQHEPDTKKLYLVKGPVTQKYIYPKFTENEWNEVLKTQTWPPGKIPENERADSFIVPHWHE